MKYSGVKNSETTKNNCKNSNSFDSCHLHLEAVKEYLYFALDPRIS